MEDKELEELMVQSFIKIMKETEIKTEASTDMTNGGINNNKKLQMTEQKNPYNPEQIIQPPMQDYSKNYDISPLQPVQGLNNYGSSFAPSTQMHHNNASHNLNGLHHEVYQNPYGNMTAHQPPYTSNGSMAHPVTQNSNRSNLVPFENNFRSEYDHLSLNPNTNYQPIPHSNQNFLDPQQQIPPLASNNMGLIPGAQNINPHDFMPQFQQNPNTNPMFPQNNGLQQMNFPFDISSLASQFVQNNFPNTETVNQNQIHNVNQNNQAIPSTETGVANPSTTTYITDKAGNTGILTSKYIGSTIESLDLNGKTENQIDDQSVPNSDPNRKRREGRDHSNYLKKIADATPSFPQGGTISQEYHAGEEKNSGPPGYPHKNSEMTVVVLDQSDDEDFNNQSKQHPFEPNFANNDQYLEPSRDVKTRNKRGPKIDEFKQIHTPTERVKYVQTTNTKKMGSKLQKPPKENNFGTSIDHRNFGYPDIVSNPSQLFDNHISEEDEEDISSEGTISNEDLDTVRTSGPYHHERHLKALNRAQDVKQHILPPQQNMYDHHHSNIQKVHKKQRVKRNQNIGAVPFDTSDLHPNQRERYVQLPSRGTPAHNSVFETNQQEMFVPASFYHQDPRNKTFLVPPGFKPPLTQKENIEDNPSYFITGPGYKFAINKRKQYQRSTRQSILTRAESLLNKRREVQTDSSTSTEEEDIEEDDYSTQISHKNQAINGSKRAVLTHINQRLPQYEDSTSYQSSDDVLTTYRYQHRAPVSVASRRARLLSFNARVRKKKRQRALQKQKKLPPAVSYDDDTSDEDIQESPRRGGYDDADRYEDSNVQNQTQNGDNKNRSNPQQPAQDFSDEKKGRRCMFFRNGDIHFKPKQVLINSKTYANLEKLLVDLGSIVSTSTGVKYIFSWPEGREIKSITELENGKYYVCSSTKDLLYVDYGNSKESFWKAGKINHNDHYLFKGEGKVQSPLKRPRVLTIISNMYRDSREKIILNTNSTMNFEEILNDIPNMVNIPNPPVRALFTETPPHIKVESYSQLIRDFANHENFIACGEEKLRELNDDQDGGQTARRKPKKNNRGENSLYNGDNNGYSVTSYGGKLGKPKKRQTDSLRIEINGKIREFFPSTLQDEDEDWGKPNKKLRLEWVYGFRGRDVKQNLSVLPATGELVYFVAAVVVLYNRRFSTQKHYMGHSEEVTCLAVHPNGRFVATGQTSGKTVDTAAHVRVWDGLSLSTYAVVGLGVFHQSIACVNFSEKESQYRANQRKDDGDGKGKGSLESTGELLMAIDDSDRHVLSVWEWQSEKLVTRTTTTTDPVISGCFYPFDDSILVTYGRQHIHFWLIFWEKGNKILRDKLSGVFERDTPKFVTSICFTPTGEIVTGDSNGDIAVWSKDKYNVFSFNSVLSSQTQKAHKKSVSSLCMLGDGTLLSGGGGEVKAWDTINEYSLVKERLLPESAGHVRTIVPMSMGGLDGSIYVATTKNKVLEGSLQLKFKFLIQGHVEELWALESHPAEMTFVTAGHDQAVIKWNAINHAPIWRVEVEKPLTSISIDYNGRMVALGTTSGKVLILNSNNGIVLTKLQAGSTQVNALSFSPDCKMLAVGMFDGFIHIFFVEEEGFELFKKDTHSLKKSSMFIMHIDWSSDSKFIQVVLGDYDVVFWEVETKQRKEAKLLRDVTWATHHSPIGYPLIGAWQNLERGQVINVATRSQYSDMLAVGDTRGRLRLYKWSTCQQKSSCHQTKVFSSNVTCSAFTCDDKYLICSGGVDSALMQFALTDPVSTR